ncbi:hypothetical protein NDU88_006917 [Pleurodeles waltl]|uniref:Uncharacterized protein n=1 Tax=Pleurodeles waltl TaxID=8319 RepID=A0AAV7PNS5_PLEWA|nr:hypothetical protein NDU88_006917 [Pleurodeles waltl]
MYVDFQVHARTATEVCLGIPEGQTKEKIHSPREAGVEEWEAEEEEPCSEDLRKEKKIPGQWVRQQRPGK